jgi:pSer/pThr/pTyr-binding forkhead associated (FHA) protein
MKNKYKTNEPNNIIKNELNDVCYKMNNSIQPPQDIHKTHQISRGSESNIIPLNVSHDRLPNHARGARKKSVVNQKLNKDITVTLTLLHPSNLIPIQNWRFEKALNIWIGRSGNNHVVLRSCVVSRHHVELRKIDDQWILNSFGSNGTYVNGQKISQVCVEDGVIVQLGRTGPAIQINLTVARVSENSVETPLQCVG